MGKVGVSVAAGDGGRAQDVRVEASCVPVGPIRSSERELMAQVRQKSPISPQKEPYMNPKRDLLTGLLRSGSPKEPYITPKRDVALIKGPYCPLKRGVRPVSPPKMTQ